jgi:long-chain acyl-CoA synthetase
MAKSLHAEILGRLSRSAGGTVVVDRGNDIAANMLRNAAEACRHVLERAGLCEFRTIVLLGGDRWEYIAAALGILGASGAMVAADKATPPAEIDQLLADLSVDFLAREAGLPGEVPTGFVPAGTLTPGNAEYHLFRRRNLASVPAKFAALDPAFIRFSSGTTGTSKGVILSTAGIRARTDAVQSVFQLAPGERVLWLLPMAYHFAATIMLFLRTGCVIELAPGNAAEETLNRLVRNDIALLYATPFQYAGLAAASGPSPAAMPRLLISTAMALEAATAEAFAARFGRLLQQSYGIIECGLPCINAQASSADVLSVGPPTPGYDVRLAFSPEFPEADGIGEVMIRGDGLFSAYATPWAERDAVMADDGFATGDLGRFDHGKLFLHGRRKNVINFLGMKIFPEAVEAVLRRHPAVAEVRVHGKPHPGIGQFVVAEVVPVANTTPSPAALAEFCREHLCAHEVPQEIAVVAHLPKTAGGKLRRH